MAVSLPMPNPPFRNLQQRSSSRLTMKQLPDFLHLGQPFGTLRAPNILLLCLVLIEFRNYGCAILKQRFPAIAQRYQDTIDYMKKEHNVNAQFGLFFNFCLNAARNGVKRVFCKPHVDWKNLAFGVCMIFVYGKKTYLCLQQIPDLSLRPL